MLRSTISYSCHPEAHNLLLLPSSGPQAPTPTILMSLASCSIFRLVPFFFLYHFEVLLPSMLLLLLCTDPQISTHSILKPTNSYSFKHEHQKIQLIPSWGQQSLNPVTLKPTCSCFIHIQALKHLLILSRASRMKTTSSFSYCSEAHKLLSSQVWGPQAPAQAPLRLLRSLNSKSCHPEAHMFLLLQSSGSDTHNSKAQFKSGRAPSFYFCHSENYKLLHLSSWSTQPPTSLILKYTKSYSCHFKGHKLLLLPLWGPRGPIPAILRTLSSCSYHEIHKLSLYMFLYITNAVKTSVLLLAG